MATMLERQAASVQKELDKLNARRIREQAKLDKMTAKAEQVGATCTREEWFAGMREAYTDEQRWWYTEAWSAEEDLKDTERRIANAEKRLAKLTGRVDEQAAITAANEQEETRIGEVEKHFLTAEQIEEKRKAKEEEYERWLSAFKAECLKDGITIERACASFFEGLTKGGKRFFIDKNCGWTTRSWHCYSLRIDGVTLFTSGEFLTAYRYLMKH